MDKRLTAAGYAIKPIFKSGSFPSYLAVFLNGVELPRSRCTLATPAGSGDAAFLAAEADAFEDCEMFAMGHLAGNGGAAELAAPEVGEPQADADKAGGRRAPAYPAGYCEICGDNFTVRFTGNPDRFACDRHADLIGGEPGGAVEADAKDATIAVLVREIKRLRGDLEIASGRLEGEGWGGRHAAESAKASRALLRRLGLALAAGLLASGLYAAPAPAGPQAAAKAPRHVTRPISSISVKVMPHAAFQGRFRASRAAWAITTADADSCTAWVDGAVPGREAAELAAFKGCQEKGGAK